MKPSIYQQQLSSWRCTLILSISLAALSSHAQQHVINIGAMVIANSTIGQAAKQAIQMAIDDINSNTTLLNGPKLTIQTFETSCDTLQGAAAAMELLEKGAVAIVGPQSSAISRFAAEMAEATNVPFVAFASTDPYFTDHQHAYFFRLSHSDAVQMAAVSAFIAYHDWKNVVAIYTDDDWGNNGVVALNDALRQVGARIALKTPLSPAADTNTIGDTLAELKNQQFRVFVIHMQKDAGMLLFAEAYNLQMISPGYVWIVTDAITLFSETLYLNPDAVRTIQGVIGLRRYIPESPELHNFLTKWSSLLGKKVRRSQLNTYSLYAYDSVWMIAHAIHSHLIQGHSFDYNGTINIPQAAGGGTDLGQLKVLKEGSFLRENILQTKFSGTIGNVQLDAKGELMGSTFEIVNMVGDASNVIGYWTSLTGITDSPLIGEEDAGSSSIKSEIAHQKLLHPIWPGGITQKPRGWSPGIGRPLRIAVPQNTDTEDFVHCPETSSGSFSTFNGFCIGVFEHAVLHLSYALPYEYICYGNKSSTADYDELLRQVANKTFDGAVGDFAITTERMELVAFTQPFIDSGLVVLAPMRDGTSIDKWAFVKHFTTTLWCTMGAFFFFTAIVIWILEHKRNQEFQGRPTKQLSTILWFIFQSPFLRYRQNVVTTLGKVVILIWLFVMFIIISNYRANLASTLTARQLFTSINGIDSLLSNENEIPIGYHEGSFVKAYLEGLGIKESRLKPLKSFTNYAEALNLGPNKGGVAAIVDENPYIQLLLSHTCGIKLVGQTFTREGWGFAFPKDSPFLADMSKAISTVLESNEIENIRQFWINMDPQCNNSDPPGELDWRHFGNLFLMIGFASLAAVVMYSLRLLMHYIRNSPTKTNDTTNP